MNKTFINNSDRENAYVWRDKDSSRTLTAKRTGDMLSLDVPRVTYVVSFLLFATAIGYVLVSGEAKSRINNVTGANKRIYPRNSRLPTADFNQTQLIYMHIAKTGGSTFNSYLSNLVGAKLNCGNFKSCCDERYHKLRELDQLDAAVQDCGHYSYEETWPLPLNAGDLDNPVYLTHVRTGVWHVLSMLGHGARAKRFDSYSSVLKNLTAGQKYPGYSLDNFQKSRFPGMGVSEVIELLTSQFFWVGLTDKYEQSLCLLRYQLGIFDPGQCRHVCASLANSDSKQSPSNLFPEKKNVNLYKIAGQNSLSQEEIKLLRSVSKEDQLIYEAMLELFHHRSAIVEERVGFRFANCHLPLPERSRV